MFTWTFTSVLQTNPYLFTICQFSIRNRTLLYIHSEWQIFAIFRSILAMSNGLQTNHFAYHIHGICLDISHGATAHLVSQVCTKMPQSFCVSHVIVTGSVCHVHYTPRNVMSQSMIVD